MNVDWNSLVVNWFHSNLETKCSARAEVFNLSDVFNRQFSQFVGE